MCLQYSQKSGISLVSQNLDMGLVHASRPHMEKKSFVLSLFGKVRRRSGHAARVLEPALSAVQCVGTPAQVALSLHWRRGLSGWLTMMSRVGVLKRCYPGTPPVSLSRRVPLPLERRVGRGTTSSDAVLEFVVSVATSAHRLSGSPSGQLNESH